MRRGALLLLASCSYTPTSQSAHDGPGSDAAIDSRPSDSSSDSPADSTQPATVTFLQGATTVSPQGGASQATLVLTQAIAAGDLCILGVGSMGVVTGVTDNRGNPFTNISTSNGVNVWVAANMQANVTDTITVQFSGTTGFTGAAAVYRGLALTSPVDGVTSHGGQGTALDSGAIVTTHPHDIVVGIVASSGTTGAAGAFTKRVGGNFSMIEDDEVTATGSYTALATATTNQNWGMAIVALKAAD